MSESVGLTSLCESNARPEVESLARRPDTRIEARRQAAADRKHIIWLCECLCRHFPGPYYYGKMLADQVINAGMTVAEVDRACRILLHGRYTPTRHDMVWAERHERSRAA